MDETDKTIMMIGFFVVIAAVLVMLALWVGSKANDRYDYRMQDLSYQEGRLDAYTGGWSEGREQGIEETETLAEAEALVGKSQAYQDGWRAGYEAGVYQHYHYRTF